MKTAEVVAQAAFEVDLRNMLPGHYLGGNAKRIVRCEVCGLGAVRLTDTLRKAGYHARYAHKLTLRLNAKLEPLAVYDERHIAREPHSQSARPKPANDNVSDCQD
jgi:hypothetical protein